MSKEVSPMNEIIDSNNNLPEKYSPKELYVSLEKTENIMTNLIGSVGLPNENIVMTTIDRKKVFNNLQVIIDEINVDKSSMFYLSKFIYAVSSGLFDAALNYLWDATITELRMRIINFNVEYFFDVTVTNTEKRAKLKNDSDLVKIQDADLLVGVKKIELIDDITYNELDHIRYMRNWSSTAHPNDFQLSGYKLIDWLETCIKSVFNLPVSPLNLEIKKLLADIKTTTFTSSDISAKKPFFSKLPINQCNSLLKGFFGIFISQESNTETRTNIAQMIPELWVLASKETKVSIGFKYGNLKINSHTAEATSARRFLDLANGQSFIPDDLRISEIANILSDLTEAHNNMNNFYTEPALAKQLYQFVGDHSNLPTSINDQYVSTVINCYITNGNGIAWSADDYYKKMIASFTDDQAQKALLSFTDSLISMKLDFPLCTEQFKTMLSLISTHFAYGTPQNLLNFISSFPTNLSKLKNDATYKKSYEHYVQTYSPFLN